MPGSRTLELGRIVVIGAGRLGRALALALADAGLQVVGPLGRERPGQSFEVSDVVLLCVPDGAIAPVAASLPVGPLVGHCSGALTLDALDPHEGFSLHPLVAATPRGADFVGAACAIAARTAHGGDVALELARLLGMQAIEIADRDRALYHAAASMASNFLVTVEAEAARLGAPVGLERRHLVHLAQTALSGWAELGGAGLTGPIARGDEDTVARQRSAVAERASRVLPLWDALAQSTRELAAERDAGTQERMTL
jgi:predicted short-subunit dehydrogenase-like oxidoreductase (DUF2520 family)